MGVQLALMVSGGGANTFSHIDEVGSRTMAASPQEPLWTGMGGGAPRARIIRLFMTLKKEKLPFVSFSPNLSVSDGC